MPKNYLIKHLIGLFSLIVLSACLSRQLEQGFEIQTTITPSSLEIPEKREIIGTTIVEETGVQINARCPGGAYAIGNDYEWSNDGSRIISTASFPNDNRILESDYFLLDIGNMLQESAEASLTQAETSRFVTSASLSPNMQLIAYASNQQTDRGNQNPGNPPRDVNKVYLDDGTGNPQLIYESEPSEWIFALKWSPKGNKIALQISQNQRFRLDILDVNSEMKFTLVDSLDVGYFSWHPNGELIAFLGKSGNAVDGEQKNHSQIYIVDVGERKPWQLIETGPCITSPVWSPDGRSLAYAYVDEEDYNSDIYTIDISTNQLSNVTRSPGQDYSPAWSPDGQRIVFVSGDVPNEESQEICVINSDGSNLNCLTNTIDAREWNPQWSPTGQWIAFFAENPSEIYLAIIQPDGSHQTQLVTLP